MSKKIRTEAVDQLFEAILCLKDKEECYTFFEDVCTINQLLSLSQRFMEMTDMRWCFQEWQRRKLKGNRIAKG